MARLAAVPFVVDLPTQGGKPTRAETREIRALQKAMDHLTAHADPQVAEEAVAIYMREREHPMRAAFRSFAAAGKYVGAQLVQGHQMMLTLRLLLADPDGPKLSDNDGR